MKRVPLDPGLDPYSLFAASRDDHPHAFILESLSGPARLAERTFVGFDPEMIISYRAGVLRSNGETVKTDRPIAALRSILAKHDASGIPGRYVGGLVGYVSYEFVRNLDSVPAHRSEEHTSDSSHITISYAVFCLKKKKHDCRLVDAPQRACFRV